MPEYSHDPDNAQQAGADDRDGGRQSGISETPENTCRDLIKAAERFKDQYQHDAYAGHADDFSIF